MASPPSTWTPVPTPFRSAWNAPLRLELAPALACWACPALTPASWSVVCSLPAALLRALSNSADCPATAPSISTANTTPIATTARNTIAVAAARGSRPPLSRRTSGESTAATIAAVTTGATIALVSDSRTATPTASAATPTSSHDIIPRSRSHYGAVKTPLSSPGASSTNSAAGSPLALGGRALADHSTGAHHPVPAIVLGVAVAPRRRVAAPGDDDPGRADHGPDPEQHVVDRVEPDQVGAGRRDGPELRVRPQQLPAGVHHEAAREHHGPPVRLIPERVQRDDADDRQDEPVRQVEAPAARAGEQGATDQRRPGDVAERREDGAERLDLEHRDDGDVVLFSSSVCSA